MTAGNENEPRQMPMLRSSSLDAHDKSLRVAACIQAIEDDNMSINEAVRWLDKDREERAGSELKPDELYWELGFTWLNQYQKDRYDL